MSLAVAVVPPVPALLPAYAGRTDPVADLRSACSEAVRWLVAAGPPRVGVVCDPLAPDALARGVRTSLAERVGRELLRGASYDGQVVLDVTSVDHVLVLANGSARRRETAPGHLDDRAFGFDDLVRAALASGDPDLLRGLDAELGDELLAAGVRGLRAMAERLGGGCTARLLHDADPFGVQYWVATWACD